MQDACSGHRCLNLALVGESSFESSLIFPSAMRSTDSDDPLIAEMLALAWRDVLGDEEGRGAEENLFDAGLESIGLMQLMIKIEKAHGIVIADGEVTRANFSTAAGLAAMVRRIKGID